MVAPSIRPFRLLLALKTAIAVGLAWPIAHLLPGAVDEYSYYAPLGALLTMMPTLAGSLWASLQTVVGIAAGVGLAWLMLQSPLPGVVTVPLAVGIGVIAAGLRGFGAGRDYVAIAALLVLVIGGSRQADDYSLGYLVQMGVGMAIGFAVNLLIMPPLHSRRSAEEVSALRREIARNLGGMADALVEEWPPEDQEWFDGVKSLRSSIRAAEPVIDEARESRRLNPRAWWHANDVRQEFDDLHTLEVLGRHTRELGETLSAAIWSDPVPIGLPENLRRPLSAALADMAELVRSWNSGDGTEEALDRVEESLRRLGDTAHDVPPNESANPVLSSAVFTLRRMLAAIAARTEPAQAEARRGW